MKPHLERLEEFLQGEVDRLQSYVSGYLLDQCVDQDHSDFEKWLFDLFQHGCVSGMVPGLIYYHQTHDFFDKFYDEIEDLRFEVEDLAGQPIRIDRDLKNTLAWFAFEETAFRIAEIHLNFNL